MSCINCVHDKFCYYQLNCDSPEEYAELKESGCNKFIDPVHAAGGCYCRECEYWEKSVVNEDICWCELTGNEVDSDDFCSYGERRVE